MSLFEFFNNRVPYEKSARVVAPAGSRKACDVAAGSRNGCQSAFRFFIGSRDNVIRGRYIIDSVCWETAAERTALFKR